MRSTWLQQQQQLNQQLAAFNTWAVTESDSCYVVVTGHLVVLAASAT
jgi:hypothetical protein